MQCSSCRAVYSNGLALCLRCSRPAATTFEDLVQLANLSAQGEPARMHKEDTDTDAPVVKTASTLIEFPGAGRTAHLPWRKELSERVREIQERRAREASIEAENEDFLQQEQVPGEPIGKPLGLVPQRDKPAINPLVVAALKRIERARQPMTHGRSSMGGASVAVARVAEEQFEVSRQIEKRPSLVPVPPPKVKKDEIPEREVQPQRRHALNVVQPKLLDENIVPVTTQNIPVVALQPNAGIPVEIEIHELDALGFYDDYAPISLRLVAGLIDLMVVAFASSPFAAIIELTNGDWADDRVLVSMSGIVILIMFLYLTSSTALGGRTWGMSLLSLRTVDVDSGMTPTTRQSVKRTIAYMLSLATMGIGLLYSIVDAEGRTAHDYVSGTTVVSE